MRGGESRDVTLLNEAGLIASTQQKGRTIMLTLTDEGKEKYEVVLDFALLREDSLLHGLTVQEKEVLVTLLHKLLENLPRVASVEPNNWVRLRGSRVLGAQRVNALRSPRDCTSLHSQSGPRTSPSDDFGGIPFMV